MKPSDPPAFSYSPRERAGCLDPLVEALLGWRREGKTVIVGIQGGQGTGKTTVTRFLQAELAQKGCRSAGFSIDDFYSGYAERKRLAGQYAGNPFYQIPRGMPGTHCTAELHAALSALKRGDDVALPVFDKSLEQGYGNRANRTVAVRGRQDFVFFEGWCVGMPDGASGEVLAACRRQGMTDLPAPSHLDDVLAHLGAYIPLWGLLDHLVMLRPDSLFFHEKWRLEQEAGLIKQTGKGMSREQVRGMVRCFYPISCLCYDKTAPDLTVYIDEHHHYYKLVRKQDGGRP